MVFALPKRNEDLTSKPMRGSGGGQLPPKGVQVAGPGGAPSVSPSSRAAHAILDQSVTSFAKQNFPQYAHMIPEKYAKMSVREAYKSAGFLEKQMFSSKIAGVLPKGVTMADIDKAANEPPPPPEKPAPAPAPAPVAAAPVAAAPPAAAPKVATAPPPARPPVAAAPPAAAPPAAAAPAPGGTLPPVTVSPPPSTGAAVSRTQNPTAGGSMGGKPLKGVNAQLVAALNRVGANYGPYEVKVISGHRPGDSREHGKGNAIDVQLIDRKTGKALPNYQNATNVAAYQQFAHAVYNDARKNDPQLAQQLRWGGYFGLDANGKPKYGTFDLMHFDTANQRVGTAGGNFQTGFSPAMQKYWKVPALSDPASAAVAPAAPGQGVAAPGTPVPEVQAGAGPAAIAAARAAAAAGTGVGTAAAGQPGAPQPGGPSYFPQGTSPETVAAINAVAAKYGVHPSAIAGVIKTESGWNTGASSPGGTYRGLTQIGQTTFNEAGGKLGGMTYDEYLKASPDKQVAAYGDWLNHYQFSDKAQRAGVDLSKLSPAQQAAYLQAFQFGPNDRTWQMAYGKGEGSGRTTPSQQAGALGDTSMNSMTAYYEKMLGKDKPGGLVDPTPDVGGGAAPAETGSGTPAPSSTPSGTTTAPGADTTTVSSAAASTGGAGGGMGDFGAGLSAMAGGMSAAMGGGAGSSKGSSGPSTVPMATLPTPPGPQSMVDTKLMELQRNQLAMAMQRLNSGKLF